MNTLPKFDKIQIQIGGCESDYKLGVLLQVERGFAPAVIYRVIREFSVNPTAAIYLPSVINTLSRLGALEVVSNIVRLESISNSVKYDTLPQLICLQSETGEVDKT